MKETRKRIAIEWRDGEIAGHVKVAGGKVVGGRAARGKGTFEPEGPSFAGQGSFRLELDIDETTGPEAKPAVVTIDTGINPFSFFLRDVGSRYPICIPKYGVAATVREDERTYADIERDVRARGLVTNLERIATEPEESFEEAARHTLDLDCQTWLGLSRDMRIFGFGFRGTGGDERSWDWVEPRYHGKQVTLPDNDDKSVRYRFLLGRGIGCVRDITRRLEEGTLPILHATMVDEDIRYDTISFVSNESSPLTSETVRGTHYLVADAHGHGHMFTQEQAERYEQLAADEKNREEETVFYFRAVATNTAQVPRYAWFKNIVPNAYVPYYNMPYTFDRQTGFVQFAEDRVCCVSKLNGQPLASDETAILLEPGESAVFEFYLPHRPVSRPRAERLIRQDFAARREECRRYWQTKLSGAAQVRLPEKRIEEMVQAGLLHLDLVSYGAEPDGTIIPTIGVYTAIGSESSPIVQFMDSMGWHKTAKRALQFFLDKQHDDGFIQNFNGYMLETGAALWSLGEHYRYTRDERWVAEVKPRLLKARAYIAAWRSRNMTEELRGRGFGMLEGKTADPEDPYHSFMLNGYAYIGLSRLAELLAASDPTLSEAIRAEAEAHKSDIRTAFFQAQARSPVVPIGDGSWVPTAPPWVEHTGPLSLFAEGGNWLTHGSFVARDSLLGPLYLVLQEVIAPEETAVDFLLQYHNELMCTRNVALSQPYYSIHPWVHLKRGEVRPFLKAYYNGFASLADRQTYTFWEHYWHVSPHKTHEEAWFLMQTRWMLYMEEGDMLKLLPGIPRKWLAHGNVIELQNVASYFGPFSLRVESDLEQGAIRAAIRCASGRAPAAVLLRLPHPFGAKPTVVRGGEYDERREAVRIDAFTGTAEVELRF
ncbi:MAG: hypothetical protein J7639_08420 [Paenibacillaceae bacterium]|nr:hypothetical protein [Paenibacillaceae bacterium]